MNARSWLVVSLVVCVGPQVAADDKKPDPKAKEIDKATVAAWEKQGFKTGWIATVGISKEYPAGYTGAGMGFYETDFFAKNELPVPADMIAGFKGSEFSGWHDVPRVKVPFGLDMEGVPGKRLEDLPALGNLTHLALGHSNTTNADLEPLAELDTLTHLSITGTHITGVGLKRLARLKNLTSLSLSGRAYSEYWLKYLGGLDNLTSLTWVGENTSHTITDEGLKYLAGLKRLTHLHLPSLHRVTDDSLQHLSGFTQLTRLDLRGSKVTDDGLPELAKLKNLRELDLRGTKVTDAGVKRLQEALPKCKIVTK